MQHNPSFKTPNGPRPQHTRSPSPPRTFVEPLSPPSPPRPTPIEPSFNYPATNNHIGFTSRPYRDAASTPRSNTHATASRKRGHHRTSSTIDTLAEAALAVSPAHVSHSRHNSTSSRIQAEGHGGYTHGAYVSSPVVTGEPPHKRARSEVLPLPQAGQHASRPATSYANTTHGPPAMSHSYYSEHTYDRRFEEAALLLNFRTGGWPVTARTPAPPPPAHHRPHANSFPQDVSHRPNMISHHAQLLPPFQHEDPQAAKRPTISRSQDDNTEAKQSPKKESNGGPDTTMAGAPARVEEVVNQKALPAEAHPKQPRAEVEGQASVDDTRASAPSTDGAPSEVAEPPKAKRGWPKGKPRGSGAKKSLAEKATTKRAAGRKKAHERGKQGKSSKSRQDAFAEVATDWATDQELGNVRRKSFGDLEMSRVETEAAPTERAQSVPREVPMFIRGASPSKPGRRAAKETICAGCATSREAGRADMDSEEWVSCNGCKQWFHIDCAGFKKALEVRDVDKYFCGSCEPTHGKTTYVRKSSRAHAAVDYSELQKGVLKTSDESNEHHYIQPIKDGTFQFDTEDFPRMRPELLTQEFLERSDAFTKPICVPAEWNPRPWKMRDEAAFTMPAATPATDAHEQDEHFPETFEYETVPDHGQDKLDMVMPQDLTVRQVCELVGPDWPLDVIEVKTQNSGQKWTLKRWADYYEQEGDDKPIRNVISLEVSQTKLGRLIRRPKIARDIDLQDAVWPQAEIDKGKYPKVQFYCLMSIADSYTDFHIDFGGSSVYYHILKGSKTFFFIPPKPKHLKAYEEWNESPQQNFTFLPHITKECYRVDLHEGDTMLIPSGWIHAVWTPSTSLVIGGNFLTRMSFHNQFRVVEIEKANETPMKFRYPFFQKIMWYTVLQYLKNDPIPLDVKELFYQGKQFERQVAIWEDFEGEIANEDERVGAQNARYYGKAEVEGWAELSNYIFRTVMTVMGRVEGMSADKQRRVNASIPKGHGEPLEIAKTFALWVAYKRGNEDPPAWAHPDAVLPNNSKDEGPPKKLSARALRDMERKEAIAAYRVAPDRQSARVVAKNASANANTNADANANTANSSSFSPPKPPPNPSPPPSDPSNSLHHHHSKMETPPASDRPPTVASPASLMISNQHGPLLSTPKTSVLGPKRVACDQCRKRRIRCKHKDLVMHVNGNSPGPPANGMATSFSGQLAPELHDNIMVTPKVRADYENSTHMSDHQLMRPQQEATNGSPADSLMVANGGQHAFGQGPNPGTSAYVNANIPMAMNGVPMFPEMAKRGRTKACVECRKSKRRCIHDDNGNVDPVKAAESPAPRGSAASKKRHSAGAEGSPAQSKRQKSTPIPDGPTGWNPQQEPHMPQRGQSGVLIPQQMTSETGATQPGIATRVSPHVHEQQQALHGQPQRGQGNHQELKLPSHEHTQQVDPSLYSLYPEPSSNAPSGPYSTAGHPYPSQEHAHAYQLPSLEQIANEVLDMNGRHHEDHSDNMFQDPTEQFVHQHAYHEHPRLFANGEMASIAQERSKPEESADSAVSMSTNGSHEANGTQQEEHSSADGTNNTASALGVGVPAHTNGTATQQGPPTGLPLYQPAARLPKSPEAQRRSAPLANGIPNQSPEATRKASQAWNGSGDDGNAMNTKSRDMDGASAIIEGVDDEQSLRLARELQQEGFGLRGRSKS
ncbi:hypothetical protein MBLNU230_g0959t1 [Neophaeotheca triangularis]